MKIYNNEEKKFGRDLYNILDTKLHIFFDCCAKVGLPKDALYNMYSIILKKHTTYFYYNQLSRRSYNFMQMVTITRDYFEIE